MGTDVAGLGSKLEAWNTALADELLDGRFEAQPLYLFVEPERLTALAVEIGVTLETAVAGSLAWSGGEALFRPHLTAATLWESRGKRGTPPYLGLLVAMTAAAAAMVSDHNFSITNYRDRLCALLDADEERAEKLKRDLHAVVRLWQSLNDWLEDWEGALGIPTARVLGRLVNVGYPISQSIVSEGDRQAMRDAFERYGLTPRRRVGVVEMTAYLGDWVGRGHAPRNLSRLWSDPTVRERIAQVACDELEHGAAPIAKTGAAATAATPAKLEWLAELTLEPMPVLELYLVSRADRTDVEGPWQVGPRTDTNGAEAIAACRDALDMRWFPELGALSLEPWGRIGSTSLFSGVLELVRTDQPGVQLLRSPGAILVMTYDERDGRYHEVSRAQLLDRCLVLAHETLAQAVTKHLGVCARPGFRQLSQAALPQLPAGWVAFIDVTLVQGADETTHGRLACLCAAPATLIGLSGGLEIGQNTWHLSHPPEALAVVDPETAPLSVSLRDRRADTVRGLGAFTGRGLIDLPALGLGGGDYELRIERQKDGKSVVVATATFRLRSADHPRPVGVRQDFGLGYVLAQPWSLLSAERTVEPQPSPLLRGGILNAPTIKLAESAAPRLELPARKTFAAERSAPRAAREEAQGQTHSCTIGPHHWICEPSEPGDDHTTMKWQDCRNCHRFEWTRNRGKAAPAPARKVQRPTTRTPSNLPRYAVRSGAAPLAYDQLLDAISYMGSGSVDTFRRLCTALDPDPWFVWRALRGLAALGHIDIAFDRATVRPRTWQVTAPCLIGAEDGTWRLAGARSQGQMDTLATTLTGANIDFEVTTPDTGPAVFLILAEPSDLTGLELDKLLSPIGMGVALSPDLGARLSAAAPRLSDLASTLPLFQPGDQGLERYDLASAVWIEAAFDRPGAYRLDYWGRTYGFASVADVASQTLRLADPALAKHLAAQAGGVSLLAYDPIVRALYAPLGAELPPLLERAAVACSGTLPKLRTDLGQLEYSAIPAEVASSLQTALHAPLSH